MSTEQNVRVIEAIYEAFGRGDVPGILAHLTDDVEWITHLDPVVPWSGEYCGKGNVPRFFERVYTGCVVQSFEPLEYISQGDVVVSIGSFGAQSTATGKSALTRWVFIWRFRDGKV